MSDPFALAAEVRAEGYLCRWSALEFRESSAGAQARVELLVTPRGTYDDVRLSVGDHREWVPANEAIDAIRAELVRVHVLPGGGPGLDPWGRARE